jgi:hypothetical protein
LAYVFDSTSDLDLTLTRDDLQPEGVEKIHPLGQITEAERALIDAAVPELASNIDKVDFVTRLFVVFFEPTQFPQGVAFVETSKL